MDRKLPHTLQIILVVSVLILGVTVLYLLPDTIRMVSAMFRDAFGFV